MSDPSEPPNLRFLRRLVTVLTGTMICGFLVVIGMFVIRFSGNDAEMPARPALPDKITLPDGARPAAFTQGSDWYAIVTDSDEILIYDRVTGALRQRVAVE